MFKKMFSKGFIISSSICLVAFVGSLIAYPFLPDTMAIHFSLKGVPDGFSSKEFVVFFIPLFLLCTNFLVFLSFEYSNKKQAASKLYSLVYKSIVPIIAIFMQTGIILYALTNINLNIVFAAIILLVVFISIFIFLKEERKNQKF